ncbi:MAG: response regulator [Verrucomicrobiae bacterium]|nr:response regulator [Verrucomicrobiae bacterium]
MLIRVYLLEARTALSAGLRAWLKELAEISLVGRTEDAARAPAEVERHRADVVVVDENLGWKALDEVLPQLGRLASRPRILVIAAHGGSGSARNAARAGAVGYLPANASRTALSEALVAVASGRLAFLPEHLPDLLGAAVTSPGADPGPLANLTARETEILRLTGEGLEAKEIGRRLAISARTVDVHRANIRNKLDISGPHELMRYAMQVTEIERLSAQLAAFCQERRSLLMVDDDDVDVLSVKRALRDLRAEPRVVAVGNGEEALAYLRTAGNPCPFLILLDINMPRMNGAEFLAELRRDRALAAIPVAVLTSSPHETDKVQMYRLGVIGYFIKPTSSREYVKLFRDLAQYWGRNARPGAESLAAA